MGEATWLLPAWVGSVGFGNASWVRVGGMVSEERKMVGRESVKGGRAGSRFVVDKMTRESREEKLTT